MMKGVKSFKELLKKDLEDPEFRKVFEEEEIYASMAITIARLGSIVSQFFVMFGACSPKF